MKDIVNNEGMTFEEWVCAAGVAKFDKLTNASYSHTKDVLPYSKTIYTERPGGIRVRKTVTYYPRTVREAWINGEDPTEWRVK